MAHTTAPTPELSAWTFFEAGPVAGLPLAAMLVAQGWWVVHTLGMV